MRLAGTKVAAAAATVALAAGLGALAAGPASAGSAHQVPTTWPGVACLGNIHLPVAPAPGQPAVWHVTGQLCATRAELARHQAVQQLDNGLTYDASYGDFDPALGYSYQRRMAAAGWASFAYSPVGTRWSSHPLSTDVTITVAVYVSHEADQDLRRGTVAGARFATAVGVGHSFWSITLQLQAATWPGDFSAVLTGSAHDDTTFHATAAADEEPAADDPAFASLGLGSGYFTTDPGVREMLYGSAEDESPAIAARDEAAKDFASATERTTGIPLLTTTLTLAISAPVLVINGSADQLDCGAVVGGGTCSCASGAVIQSEEAPRYSPRAHLAACVVPGAGHSWELAINHDTGERDVIAWLRGEPMPADCCRRAA